MCGMFRAAHEFRGREGDRLGIAHNVVSQQTIVRGALADRACPEPEFDDVLFRRNRSMYSCVRSLIKNSNATYTTPR